VDLPAIRFLSETVERIVADRVVTSTELRELLSAIDSILDVPESEKSIEASCDECGRKYKAAEALSGQLLRCPKCGGVVVVPVVGAAAAFGAANEEFWSELDRNHSSPDQHAAEVEKESKRTDEEVRRSYTPVSGASAKGNNSFRDYAPITLGMLAVIAGFFGGVFAFASGRKDLLPWIALASGVFLIGAIVWWFSRYRTTLVHIQQKTKDWRTETRSYTDSDGNRDTREVVVYRYFLDTDHGYTEVSGFLFRRLKQGAVYKLMTQMVDGELNILDIFGHPAKRLR